MVVYRYHAFTSLAFKDRMIQSAGKNLRKSSTEVHTSLLIKLISKRNFKLHFSNLVLLLLNFLSQLKKRMSTDAYNFGQFLSLVLYPYPKGTKLILSSAKYDVAL